MEIKHVLGVAALFVVCLTLQAECMLFTKDAECHRLRTKLDDIRPRCFYMCHMPDGQLRMGAEEDGTPCRFFGRTGSCNSGLCIPEEMRKYLEERKRRIEERRRRIDGDKKTGGGADKGTDDNSASTPPAS